MFLNVKVLMYFYFLFNLINLKCGKIIKNENSRNLNFLNDDKNNLKIANNLKYKRLVDVNNVHESGEDSKNNDDGSSVTDNFNFIGFKIIESIPVAYPQDICFFHMNNIKYAASLHTNGDNMKYFVIFEKKENEYIKIFSLPTPLAISMDCLNLKEKAYFSLIYNHTSPVPHIVDGSPVYILENNVIKSHQFFTFPNIKTMKLRSHGNDILLLQVYQNSNSLSSSCIIYKWFNDYFNVLQQMPCENVNTMEFFKIDDEFFLITVLNVVKENYEKIEKYTKIYKFNNVQGNKMVLYQKIKLNSLNSSDVKYFEIKISNNEIQRFLIFTNIQDHKDQEMYSVIYKYTNEQFFTFQRLPTNSVKDILPVQIETGKFLLLIACENENVKYFVYDGWKFKESDTKLTEGSLGKGVTKLRIFKEFNNTFVVVSNEKMLPNETNIYEPLFKKSDKSKLSKSNILQWAKDAYEKVSKVDINQLKTKIENLSDFDSDHSKSHFFEIKKAVTNTIIHPRKNMNKEYWETLKLLQRATNSLEERYNKLKSKILSQKKQQLFERLSVEKNLKSEQIIDDDTLYVDTLVIHHTLNTQNINNQSQTVLKLNSINANEIILNVTEGMENTSKELTELLPNQLNLKRINAKNVQISNLLNDIELEDLQKNTLKKFGNQTIRSEFLIDKLYAKNLMNKDTINDMKTSKLIQITNGSYVVNQDIQFAEPVYVNNLIVNERLNNIHVFQGKLDVLLTDSKEPQIINAFKQFESIKLLEPVTIGGKIFGPHIDKMNPTLTINDDIKLNGDFTINGDVLIRKFLSAKNAIFKSENNIHQDVKKIFENGLKINESLAGIYLEFEKPIFVKNLNVQQINGKDISMFVRMNTDNVQTINGLKIFKNDLIVDKGFCEMNNVNGIDVDKLNRSIFRKFGNQNINEEMHFKEIIIERLNSNHLYLKNTSIQNILSRTKLQEIIGNIEIDNVITDYAQVNNLATTKRIFNYDLQDYNTFENFLKSSDEILIIDENKIIKKNLQVKNLIIKKQINGQKIDKIEKLLSQLNENIEFNDPINFTSNMKILNLTFDKNLNGIRKDEFGKNWLLSETNQEFTAPQIFTKINCEDLQTLEKINGYTFDDLIKKTYWITRSEHIENVIFDRDITLPNDSITINGLINGINFTENVLLKNGVEFQTIDSQILCENDVIVNNGQIKILSTLNQFNIPHMLDIFNGNISRIAIRNAYFKNQPKFQKLNSIDVKEFLNNAWFKHQPITLKGNIKFLNGEFSNVLSSQGTLNDVNLVQFKNTYFSKSIQQFVNRPVKFQNDVVFKEFSNITKMALKERVIDLVSKSSIKFDEFVSRILTVSGTQNITGLWNIHEAIVIGALNNIRINELNLVNDVLRYDQPINNITAPKYLHNSAHIQRIFCEPLSLINNIDMLEWIKKTVFVYENFTIQGTTKIDSILLYNDINVFGLVNNYTFDENTLLLKNKDQIIRGNVEIITKYPDKQKILPLIFDEIQTITINDYNINNFLNNTFELNDFIKLNNNLKFSSPLFLNNLNVNNKIFNVNIKNVINRYVEFSKFLQKIKDSVSQIQNNDN